MKLRITSLTCLLIFAVSGCENNDLSPVPAIEGLSLYWDHEVFGEGGRRLRFEFNSSNEFDNDHELVFDYSIDGNSITAALIESIDKGKCQYYPMPTTGNDDPHKCHASGGFYIPDEALSTGIYSFKIVTPDFEVTTALNVSDEQVTLTIPANEHLTTSINHVYPIPANVLFGSVVYEGSDNAQDASDFLEALTSAGLTEIVLPDHSYRHLSVDENGEAIDSHWADDDHALGLLYKMNSDFDTIVELSKEHFHKTNLDIYLYTSNGDEGLMSQRDGITIVYGQ
jgi:hypothetical protein